MFICDYLYEFVYTVHTFSARLLPIWCVLGVSLTFRTRFLVCFALLLLLFAMQYERIQIVHWWIERNLRSKSKYCKQNGVYAHAQSEHWALIKILIKMFKSEFRFIQIFRPRLAFALDLAELWILKVKFEPQLILIDFNRTYQFRLKKNRWTPCKIRTSELSTCVFNRGPL